MPRFTKEKEKKQSKQHFREKRFHSWVSVWKTPQTTRKWSLSGCITNKTRCWQFAVKICSKKNFDARGNANSELKAFHEGQKWTTASHSHVDFVLERTRMSEQTESHAHMKYFPNKIPWWTNVQSLSKLMHFQNIYPRINRIVDYVLDSKQIKIFLFYAINNLLIRTRYHVLLFLSPHGFPFLSESTPMSTKG